MARGDRWVEHDGIEYRIRGGRETAARDGGTGRMLLCNRRGTAFNIADDFRPSATMLQRALNRFAPDVWYVSVGDMSIHCSGRGVEHGVPFVPGMRLSSALWKRLNAAFQRRGRAATIPPDQDGGAAPAMPHKFIPAEERPEL